MLLNLAGKQIDTARIPPISIEAGDADLGRLSDAAVIELRRLFDLNARVCGRALFSTVKKNLRTGIEQLARQLTAEINRRKQREHGPAGSLTLIFASVEQAGFLAAFLTGLSEVYIGERAKIAQSEGERGILDMKSVTFQCSEFCRLVASAIYHVEVEV